MTTTVVTNLSDLSPLMRAGLLMDDASHMRRETRQALYRRGFLNEFGNRTEAGRRARVLLLNEKLCELAELIERRAAYIARKITEGGLSNDAQWVGAHVVLLVEDVDALRAWTRPD